MPFTLPASSEPGLGASAYHAAWTTASSFVYIVASRNSGASVPRARANFCSVAVSSAGDDVGTYLTRTYGFVF